MVHFQTFRATQILSGIVVFLLMFVGGETAIADDFIPGLLRVMVNTKVKDANKRIDDFLKEHQDIKILPCNKNSKRKSFCKNGNKSKSCRGSKKYPYRDIRVPPGYETVWIQKLTKSSLVRKVQWRKCANGRLPTVAIDNTSKQTVEDDFCVEKQAPFFSLTSRDKAMFQGLDNFLRNIYQAKCGDCVHADDTFPRSRNFSIVDLNQEVIREEDFVEVLEFSFLLIDGEVPELMTVVNGQYASAQWKGKKAVPSTEFQEMRCQYGKQLKAYASKLKEKLEGYLK